MYPYQKPKAQASPPVPAACSHCQRSAPSHTIGSTSRLSPSSECKQLPKTTSPQRLHPVNTTSPKEYVLQRLPPPKGYLLSKITAPQRLPPQTLPPPIQPLPVTRTASSSSVDTGRSSPSSRSLTSTHQLWPGPWPYWVDMWDRGVPHQNPQSLGCLVLDDSGSLQAEPGQARLTSACGTRSGGR